MSYPTSTGTSGRPLRKVRLIGGVVLIGSLSLGIAACSDSDTKADTAESSTKSTLRTVDVKSFKELITNDASVKILDVRTPDEFAAGHISGASNIDFENANFDDQISKLDPTANYAIYCRSGNRSGQALKRMKAAGFTRVTNLDGGTVAWTAAGFSLE